MPTLAARLIEEERNGDDPSDTDAHAALRICEKLRRPLSTLAGSAGFHSLLSRAWVLAKGRSPWLARVQIKPDGSFQFSPGETQLASPAAAEGAHAWVTELLALLVTFIGEALTLRLVHEVWPDAVTKHRKQKRNSL